MKTLAPKISEAELCAGFIAVAATHGWTAYPEFAGFDFLLVRNGIQVGFQAKLHFNIHLLRQITPSPPYWSDRGHSPGPHFLAVLIPKWSLDAYEICQHIGIAFFCECGFGIGNCRPRLSQEDFSETTSGSFHIPQWSDIPLPLPDYIPDVRAGASAPIQLTAWKIAALKISAVAELRGYVTRSDFRVFDIDHRRWIESGWVRYEHKGGEKLLANKLPFPAQHPKVYAEIKAELAEYAAADPPISPKRRRRK